MVKRQILIPSIAFPRVEERLKVLPELDIALWSPEAIQRQDGSPISPSELKPEIAWIPIDMFFTGQFLEFVEAFLTPGSVKWVQACLAGTDAPPFHRIREAKIRLSNSDSPNAGVAEYVMSSVLNVVHKWPERQKQQAEERWVQEGWREIGEMKWLVVGFGSIGGEVAKRARAFGAEVVGARRTRVVDDRATKMVTMAEIHNELPDADIVIIACPLNDATRGLVDENFFSQMKPESILVNVARGPVVDTKALLSALDRNELSHAILDVFDVEPLNSGNLLWQHPSVTMTSHIAGAGSGITSRGDNVFIEQLTEYLAGRPLRLEVK